MISIFDYWFHIKSDPEPSLLTTESILEDKSCESVCICMTQLETLVNECGLRFRLRPGVVEGVPQLILMCRRRLPL